MNAAPPSSGRPAVVARLTLRLGAHSRHTVMRPPRITFALLSSIALAGTAATEEISVRDANGVQLAAKIDFPSGEGPFPAIVMAPGQGYHMNMPAMEEVAIALREQGIAVFRFNWAYFTAQPKGQPSDDLSNELKDLQAVLLAARKHPKVLARSLSVGGKSLGSIVAWKALAADVSLRSALLLTPICSRVPKGEAQPRSEAAENYPAFSKERRPTLWIAGDRDPLCAPPILYNFAAAGTGAVRVAIVGGDHSYESRTLSPQAAEAARKRNIAAVSTMAASFLAELATAPTGAP